jgi:DNA-nicking Smr family endonuclease
VRNWLNRRKKSSNPMAFNRSLTEGDGAASVECADGKKRRKKNRIDEQDACSPVAVKIPITGVLDLHTFSPDEVEPLVDDYLAECLKRDISEVRIIHGKGRGVQRRRVQSILARNSMVLSYHDADPDRGGWGATIAVLAKRSSTSYSVA